MKTDKDHIHILADIDPSFGVMKFIKTAKGRSSRILRDEFAFLVLGLKSPFRPF